MLRGMIKEVACSIPTVRRVFEQRDTAMAQAEAARRQLQDAQREAAELSSELSALTGGVEGSAPEILPEYSKAGFSHWGEDFIVEFIFSSVMDGRYLDIGCFHPALYSNTMRLYRKGWSGVNVDPNPFMIEQCLAMRPRDVSLNKAVGKEHGSIEYYSFHDWASSNTASQEFARVIAENQNLDMPVGKSVELVTLSEIMAEHFSDRTPEFVNIDVEDLDVDVLQSGDWSRYRPKVIAIEDIKFSSDAPDDSAIYRFLKAQGYRMFSRCVYTSFFIEKDFNANSFQFP